MPVDLNQAADMKHANPIKETTVPTSKTEATVSNVELSETFTTGPVVPSRVTTHPTIEGKPTVVPDKPDSMVTTAEAPVRPAGNIEESGLGTLTTKLASASNEAIKQFSAAAPVRLLTSSSNLPGFMKPNDTYENKNLSSQNTKKNINSEEDLSSPEKKPDKDVDNEESTSDNEYNAPKKKSIFSRFY